MAPIAQLAEVEATITPDYVLHWVKELNVANQAILKLKGGINNRVYRCGSGANAYVIKSYQESTQGERDRMQAEVEFLRYAGETAKEFVPQLIEVDWRRRCVVLEHIPGQSYRDGCEPTKADIEAACEFARQINSEPEKAKQFITVNAAEGYKRVTEHIANVSERLKNMSVSHLPSSYREPAKALVENAKSKLNNITDKTIRLIQRGELNDSINRDHLCVSPSDFGFHNAIRNKNGIKFFDFEFAGWDDPAKLIADFILQPRVQVRVSPSQLIKIFRPESAKEIYERHTALGPILQIKWGAIILSILNPKRLEQILEIHQDTAVEILIKQRIKIATHHLNNRTPFGLY